MRLAAPVVIQHDLSTSKAISGVLVDSDSGALQAEADDVLQLTIESQRGQFLIHPTVRNLTAQSARELAVVRRPLAEGLIGALDQVSKEIDSGASAFSTRRDDALSSFVAALGASDAQTRRAYLETATRADPGFGLAYVALIDTAVQAHQDAQPIIARARANLGRFTPLDRARVIALDTRLSHAPLRDQARTAASVLALAPNNVDTLTVLGSLNYLEGDAVHGSDLLHRALELSPGNIAVRRQMARGLLEAKQFRAAEQILNQIGVNSSVLPELAVCVLLEGDTARADAIFAKYLEQQQAVADPAVPLLRANWNAISTGTARKSGDHPAIEADPQRLLAYKLFLSGDYAHAVPVWREIYDRSGNLDLASRAMLAASLERSGKQQEASALCVEPFVPDLARDPYAAISFAEMRRLLHL